MSLASEEFEKAVADSINCFSKNGFSAIKSRLGTKYSDVLIKKEDISVWLEVKMNHNDNLANPRVFFANGIWQSSYSTPVASFALKELNSSKSAKLFIDEMVELANSSFDTVYVPTTKSGLKDVHAVPLSSMKNYFQEKAENRYIHVSNDQNIAEITTDHYILGKAEPAFYMQAGDNFYMISNNNPLGLSSNIPLLEGSGDFKVRVSTRSKFYEIQTEVKLKNSTESDYSLLPNSRKKNPLLHK